MAAKSREIEEEILNWVDRPDEELLKRLGESVIEQDTLGFQDITFEETDRNSNSKILSENWFERNFGKNVSKYDNIEIDNEIDLSIFIFENISSEFPRTANSLVSILCARKILRERPKREKLAQGKIPSTNSNLSDNEKSKLTIQFTSSANALAVGKMLCEAREAAGLTKVAVAEAMGTSESSVRRMEAGGRSPSIDTIQRYAEAVGLKAVVILEHPEAN